MESSSNTTPPHRGPDETLREYLATAEASCPSCRYNLRGCETSTCPECGWSLRLQLRPRLATVPHWLFGLMIFGWLAVMGIGGALAQAERFWQYHRVVNIRWMRQNNQAQSRAIVQQYLTQAPVTNLGSGPGAGSILPPAGSALAAPVVPPQTNFAESVRTYFAAMHLQDQIGVLLFMAAAAVGVLGLLLIPVSRRCSPRFNTLFVATGSVLFSMLVLNYLLTYISMWRSRF
ncbi:MAG: hypothetical protein K2Y21_10870 [Phycisphaerales bacterium]|nr:hypothetical protein [Phycisphaerales bacterium]